MQSTLTSEAPRSKKRTRVVDSREGHAAPLGATVTTAGVNFSVFSKDATALDLLLFDHDDDPRPPRVIRIDPRTNRHYHYWHTFVPGLVAGQIYGYCVAGPFAPDK